MAIVGPDRQPLPEGEVGELAFRGASLFLGHYKDPATTAATRDAAGWFYTGDLGQLDADGYLRILGRSKDVIDRGGVKYDPLEIEELLLAHPRVTQVAIVGLPDPRLGEGEPPTLAELCGYLEAQGIARHKLPERLEILPELPVTPTRKIQKGMLRQLVAEKVRVEVSKSASSTEASASPSPPESGS